MILIICWHDILFISQYYIPFIPWHYILCFSRKLKEGTSKSHDSRKKKSQSGIQSVCSAVLMFVMLKYTKQSASGVSLVSFWNSEIWQQRIHGCIYADSNMHVHLWHSISDYTCMWGCMHAYKHTRAHLTQTYATYRPFICASSSLLFTKWETNVRIDWLYQQFDF